jgi:hypothetical protein
MSLAGLIRAVLALALSVAVVLVAVKTTGFPVVGGFIGVRVGVPLATVELVRNALPIVAALLFAVYAIRFGFRALRKNVTLSEDVARGGKLLNTTAWALWAVLVVELLYRQLFLGWATLFGDLARSLTWLATAVALLVVLDRLVPWPRAPRGVRHLGLFVVVAVALLTALSAWSHRGVVSGLALAPVALVGLALLVSGVRRVETGPRFRATVELALSSALLTAPLWRLFT